MFSTELSFASDIARRAGVILREGLKRPRQIELKGPYDVVTEIDRASEALLRAAIQERYPNHTIIGEETGEHVGSSNYQWLLDPVDGTNNYAHGFPYFCVTLALCDGHTPVLGVTYDPLRDELFCAEQGRGAWCNTTPIAVSAVATIAQALLSTGFPYDFGARTRNNAVPWYRLQAASQGVRRAGAAALDLAYVAAGRLDAHWELSLQPWDCAAGLVLLAEAGGHTSDYAGQPVTPWSGPLVTSNGHIHAELLAILNAAEAA